jgi:hypothetical protein
MLGPQTKGSEKPNHLLEPGPVRGPWKVKKGSIP